MPVYYRTKHGEMLDWICWLQYGQRRRLEDAARQLGFYSSDDAKDVLHGGINSLSQLGEVDLQGMVERVLDSNPGLANLGPVLPAGITITLPDLTPKAEDTQVVQLWDD